MGMIRLFLKSQALIFRDLLIFLKEERNSLLLIYLWWGCIFKRNVKTLKKIYIFVEYLRVCTFQFVGSIYRRLEWRITKRAMQWYCKMVDWRWGLCLGTEVFVFVVRPCGHFGCKWRLGFFSQAVNICLLVYNRTVSNCGWVNTFG